MSGILQVCPYCGNEYGAILSCCGESIAHAVYIVEEDQGACEFPSQEAARNWINEIQSHEKVA